MQAYHIRFVIRSSVLTPFFADTVFGSLCWSYRYLYGEELLVAFLKESETTPLLILSDGCPKGYLPMPILGAWPNKLRKSLHHQWIQVEALKQLCETPISAERLSIYQVMQQPKADELYKTRVVYRSSINRLTGAVQEGLLYPLAERFYEEGAEVEFYLRICEHPLMDEGILKQLLHAFSLTGYGKKKSSGRGQLEWDGELHALTDQDLSFSPEPNAFMSLSTFVPRQSDPRRGYYALMTKHGRLGEEFAFRPTSAAVNAVKPFKRPLIMLRAGSTFFLEGEPLRDSYGRLVADVHEHNDIRQHGFAYPLGLKIEDDSC